MAQVQKAIEGIRKDQVTKNQQRGALLDIDTGSMGKGGRKRKLMTFSELTDVVVEDKIRTEQQWWALAKQRKCSGDDILWNTLGERGFDVDRTLNTIVRAWSEAKSASTLKPSVKFPLTDYTLPWMVKAMIFCELKVFYGFRKNGYREIP